MGRSVHGSHQPYQRAAALTGHPRDKSTGSLVHRSLANPRTGDGHLLPWPLKEVGTSTGDYGWRGAWQISELEAKGRPELRVAQPSSPESGNAQ